MEDLKIFDESGATLLSRTLTEERGPLLVLRTGDGVELSASAAEGAEVLGALVRDEDGWTLASADASALVSCGGKGAGSLPLVPGSACLLGGFVFRVESNASSSGNVLLWRVGKSPVAAEPVMAGRNLVAADSLRGGVLTVNPSLAGVVLFEFYPTLDGLDLVMPSGGRMSVERRICFAVGSFQGVLLSAEEAAAALKSGDPFGYPSRRVRRRLMAALLGAGLVCLGATYLTRQAGHLEKLAEEPHGAVCVKGGAATDLKAYFGDEYIYMLAFYRDLPLVLGPKPSPVAADLVKRAASFKDNARVQRAARFLRDVTEIQQLILARRWNDLAESLKKVDAEMFVIADATRFLDDAREVVTCADVLLPQSAVRFCSAGSEERKALEAKVANALSDMEDNRFVKSVEMRAWLRQISEESEALKTFLRTRDRAFAAKEVTAADVQSLRQDLGALDAVFGGTVPELREAIGKSLEEFATSALTDLLARFRTVKDYDRALSAVGPLCDLAADVGAPSERLASWRRRAFEISRLVEAHLQDCYQRYRLRGADNPVAARQALDEILAVGDPTNKFYDWARKERDRLDGEVKK